MKFHFFVLATCITRQNEQTTKRNGRKTSFCRVVVLSFWCLVKVDKTNKRQNEQVTKTNQTLIFRGNFVVLSFRRAVRKATKRTNEEIKSISLFWRLVQRDKTNKRRNEILIFRFRDCSFWRLDQRDKTKKRRNEIPFLRFGDLCNATKRTNEEIKF